MKCTGSESEKSFWGLSFLCLRVLVCDCERVLANQRKINFQWVIQKSNDRPQFIDFVLH